MFFYLTFTANILQHVVCSNIIATNFLLPFSLYSQKYLLTKQKNTSWSVTVLYYFSHFNCIYDELLNIIICFKFCKVLNQALPDINRC